jgi:hypothetical protein
MIEDYSGYFIYHLNTSTGKIATVQTKLQMLCFNKKKLEKFSINTVGKSILFFKSYWVGTQRLAPAH